MFRVPPWKNRLDVPVFVTVVWTSNVPLASVCVLVLTVAVDPDVRVVVPLVPSVPPVQLNVPPLGTVRLSEPPMTAPDRVRVAMLSASPLLKFTVPLLAIRLVPKLVTVAAGLNVVVPPL